MAAIRHKAPSGKEGIKLNEQERVTEGLAVCCKRMKSNYRERFGPGSNHYLQSDEMITICNSD